MTRRTPISAVSSLSRWIPARTRRRTAARAVLVVALLLGCGPVRMYSGPPLPADRVAILEIGNIRLMTLDDRALGTKVPARFEVLPGEHFMRASHNMPGYPDQVLTYTFSAEAGHRYRFDADYEFKRTLVWRPWVKDLFDGKIVGSWR